MIQFLQLVTALALLLGCSFRAAGDEGERRDRYPTKLPPENRAAYGALLDQLDSNTAMLHEVFKSGDQQREDELYAERQRILIACQGLMPSPVGEPEIDEGIVDSKHGTRLGLRLSESRGISLSVGRIANPELQQQYDAIQIGDRIRLVFTNQPDLYDNDRYSYQLQDLKRIGPGVRNFDIRQQDRQEDFQDTTVMVLHPDPASETVVILATIKNNMSRAIDFANDQQYFLKVTGSSEVELPYHIRHQTPVIGPDEVGVILLEVLKKDFEGRHLNVRAGTRTGSLLSADIEVER